MLCVFLNKNCHVELDSCNFLFELDIYEIKFYIKLNFYKFPFEI